MEGDVAPEPLLVSENQNVFATS